MSPNTDWLKTSEAVVALGLCRDTLLRRRNDGYLQRGDHWITTSSAPNAAILWNVEAIRTQMGRWRGPEAIGHAPEGGGHGS